MFTLPKLPFGYADLEPYIDEETLHVHYDKHHQGYCNKLNAALEGLPEASDSLKEILIKATSLPASVKNNAGGVWNHAFYWECMGKNSDEPTGELLEAIKTSFGSLEGLKEKFIAAAGGVFGSGWAWLLKQEDGSLTITTSANQDNPLTEDANAHPVMVCDVWEHAYYLKYKNLRPDYLENFWNVINWEKVSQHYAEGYTFG